jgi:dTDP-4-amino-4,6-dideoxygalactose transaminase
MYNERYAGTMGDIGCFSFHARKGITTGEGGMIVTNDRNIAEKVRFLSVFGMKTAWEREKSNRFMVPIFSDLGYNYKMSDITAAVGVAQLKKIDHIIRRKRELAKIWNEALDRIDTIEAPFVSQENFHIYQSYVTVAGKQLKRDKIIEKLRSYEIQTQIGTYACHIQPLYNTDKQCAVSLDIFKRALALPLYFQLEEEQIEMMASRLKYIVRECE